MVMADKKKPWDQDTFDQKMKDSLNDLASLRMELQNLLVKFGLRALKQYQAARNYPLRANEIARLVKYEIDNAIMDVSEKERPLFGSLRCAPAPCTSINCGLPEFGGNSI